MEEEDEEEEGELLVEGMDMMGEDDFLFMSSEEGTGGSPTADMVALFDGEGYGGFGDTLFPLPLQSSKGESNNTTTTTSTTAGEAFSVS